MKYVIAQVDTEINETQHTVLIPLMFPNWLVHSEMYDMLIDSYAYHKTGGYDYKIKPFSAGEYNAITGKCSGNSESLGVKSRGDLDSQEIKMNDYSWGIQ